MERQEKRATIISFVTIVAFMAVVAGAQTLPGAKNEKGVNLLADIANVSAPAASAPPVAVATPAASAAASAPVKQSTPAATPAKTPATQPSASVRTTSAQVVEAPPPQRSTPSSITAATSTSTSTPPPATSTPATPARVLPYSVGTFGNYFVNGDGWSGQAGAVSQTDGVLVVSADPSTTVGNALLSGTNDWSNYTFRATVDWVKGETFGLMARYTDPKDFLACEFDERNVGTVEVSFKKYVNGVATTLATGDVNNYEQVGGVGIDAAIAVDGNTGTCFFNGTQVSTFDIDSAGASVQQQGGIGFTTWDPAMDDSEIIVHTVGVISGAYQFGSSS